MVFVTGPEVVTGPGLYVHIPFCKARCSYCDFYTLAGADDLRERTALAILREAALRAPTWTGGPFDSVYLGGGTPSHLGPRILERLLKGLRERLPIAAGAEWTIEANPDSATAALLEAALRGGANRLSLGVQSFEDEELAALERLHDAAGAEDAYARGRSAGFENVSIDLIYGLPEPQGRAADSPAVWERSLRRGIHLDPDHVSCYLLTLEPHVPMARRGLKLPGDARSRSEYDLARRVLLDAGFGQYEISNWSRPGRECRHNVNVWRGGDYLGLGPGAHGHAGGTRRANRPHLRGYLAAVEAGEDAPNDVLELAGLDRAEERVMLGLRLREGVAWALIEADFGPARARALRERAAIWTARGLLEDDGVRLRLGDPGLFVSNALTVELLGER